MRVLLESSWMKFGPAGRDSLDWVPGPSALPSTDRQSSGSGPGDAVGTGPVLYIVIATVSFFLLLLLSLLVLLAWRRRRGGCGVGSKLELANVIALEDLRDPERNGELLSSIRRSGSGDDVTEGVFLMVYLPSPYEQTLTRIARAASMCSAKDAEMLPPNPVPEAWVRAGAEDAGTCLKTTEGGAAPVEGQPRD